MAESQSMTSAGAVGVKQTEHAVAETFDGNSSALAFSRASESLLASSLRNCQEFEDLSIKQLEKEA